MKMSIFKLNHHKYFLFLTIFFVLTLTILMLTTNLENSTKPVILERLNEYFKAPKTISCYRYDPGSVGTLPDISDMDVKPGESIFFHETSCSSSQLGKIYIKARQACAVESAARLHPQFDVYLTFSSPGIIKDDYHPDQDHSTRQSDRILKQLQSYPNIKIVHLNFGKYVKNTPLEDIYLSGNLDASPYSVSHASDILRYLTLHKYGGIYMDMDVIVIKNMADLHSNFAGAESSWDIAAGVMRLTPGAAGHMYATELLNELRNSYNHSAWGNNGPGVITRYLRKLCKTEDAVQIVNKTCDQLHTYPDYVFYPVHWRDWGMYFDAKQAHKVWEMARNSYSLHMWNMLSESSEVPVNSLMPYAMFANLYCPKVFRQCEKYFQ